jgi:hypothetical protein
VADGGFVALVTHKSPYTASSGVARFGPDGSVLWQYGENREPAEKGGLPSPKAVAVASDGRVVVLDVIRHVLQVLDESGEFVTSVNLDEA